MSIETKINSTLQRLQEMEASLYWDKGLRDQYRVLLNEVDPYVGISTEDPQDALRILETKRRELESSIMDQYKRRLNRIENRLKAMKKSLHWWNFSLTGPSLKDTLEGAILKIEQEKKHAPIIDHRDRGRVIRAYGDMLIAFGGKVGEELDSDIAMLEKIDFGAKAVATTGITIVSAPAVACGGILAAAGVAGAAVGGSLLAGFGADAIMESEDFTGADYKRVIVDGAVMGIVGAAGGAVGNLLRSVLQTPLVGPFASITIGQVLRQTVSGSYRWWMPPLGASLYAVPKLFWLDQEHSVADFERDITNIPQLETPVDPSDSVYKESIAKYIQLVSYYIRNNTGSEADATISAEEDKILLNIADESGHDAIQYFYTQMHSGKTGRFYTRLRSDSPLLKDAKHMGPLGKNVCFNFARVPQEMLCDEGQEVKRVKPNPIPWGKPTLSPKEILPMVKRWSVNGNETDMSAIVQRMGDFLYVVPMIQGVAKDSINAIHLPESAITLGYVLANTVNLSDDIDLTTQLKYLHSFEQGFVEFSRRTVQGMYEARQATQEDEVHLARQTEGDGTPTGKYVECASLSVAAKGIVDRSEAEAPKMLAVYDTHVNWMDPFFADDPAYPVRKLEERRNLLAAYGTSWCEMKPKLAHFERYLTAMESSYQGLLLEFQENNRSVWTAFAGSVEFFSISGFVSLGVYSKWGKGNLVPFNFAAEGVSAGTQLLERSKGLARGASWYLAGMILETVNATEEKVRDRRPLHLPVKPAFFSRYKPLSSDYD